MQIAAWLASKVKSKVKKSNQKINKRRIPPFVWDPDVLEECDLVVIYSSAVMFLGYSITEAGSMSVWPE